MNELIYCQREIPRGELRYGFRASAETGCGWIATYNALRLLGKRADKEEIIRYYERQLPLVHGNAGTASGVRRPSSCTTASGWSRRSDGSGLTPWRSGRRSASSSTTGARG